MTDQQAPEVKCPKCGSNQIVAGKKGFSGKKAVAGAVLTGGIGILAGTIGSNKIQITCLNCGNEFTPGDSAKAAAGSELSEEAEKFIVETIEKEGMLKAIANYKNQSGYDLETSRKVVEQIKVKYNVTPKPASPAAVMIMILIVAAILILFIKNCS